EGDLLLDVRYPRPERELGRRLHRLVDLGLAGGLGRLSTTVVAGVTAAAGGQSQTGRDEQCGDAGWSAPVDQTSERSHVERLLRGVEGPRRHAEAKALQGLSGGIDVDWRTTRQIGG